jgi:heat shock protein HtpX
MQLLKRRWLFLLTNLAIIILINIILVILERYFGISIMSGGYTGLLVMAFAFGFVGAIVNLQISRWMAKRAYKIQLVDEQTSVQHPHLSTVYRTVQKIATEHDITMPEVGFYQDSSPNAFATWPSKNRSLVAVSSGLLDRMSPEEIEWVIGHEMAHVLNGDMVTMTLLQGILNTFTIFFARVIATAISAGSRDENNQIGGFAYFAIVMVLDIILGMIASLILMWYSRQREFAADAGSADSVGTQKMIAALRKLQSFSAKPVEQDQYAIMKINGGKVWLRLFSSHPSLESRIEALVNR